MIDRQKAKIIRAVCYTSNFPVLISPYLVRFVGVPYCDNGCHQGMDPSRVQLMVYQQSNKEEAKGRKMGLKTVTYLCLWGFYIVRGLKI